jgi:two-component sensor histidine kinase
MHYLPTINAARYSSAGFRPVRELGIGLLGSGCALLLALVLKAAAPEVNPLALICPLILIGTLYGHSCAGLLAAATIIVWGWWQVAPPARSFGLEDPSSVTLVAVHAGLALITLIFALAFRRGLYVALEERDREIQRGEMLIAELEHRTKNNFALVVSLLQAQKRQEGDPRVARALDLAQARIHSFARAYANLAKSQAKGACVAMKPYLTEVVSHFADGGLPDNVSVAVDVCDFLLPREEAVGIGLFVNEALTNCAKHAFPAGASGRIDVKLSKDQQGWQLVVEDNGVGFDPPQDPASRGTGSRLMQAFARQAQASFTLESLGGATRLRLASLPRRDRHAHV